MFSIRNIRKEDVPEVAVLEKEIFPDAWSERAIRETMEQKQARILIAREDKVLVGYLILYYVLEDGEIARIAVNPEFRRQGIAGRMLHELEDLCVDLGVQKLLLEVRESNEPARAFYEGQGFEQDGVRRNYYSDPVEDGILMSLELKNNLE